jgi:hypothetical protein
MSVARGSGWEEGAGGKRGREVGWGGDERGAHHGARQKKRGKNKEQKVAWGGDERGAHHGTRQKKGGKKKGKVRRGRDERGAHHGARHKAAENLPMRQGLKQRLANILKRQEKNYVLKKQVNK